MSIPNRDVIDRVLCNVRNSLSPLAAGTLSNYIDGLENRIHQYEKVGREIEKIVSAQALTIDTLKEYETLLKYFQWWVDQRAEANKLSHGQLVGVSVRADIPVLETLREGLRICRDNGQYKP